MRVLTIRLSNSHLIKFLDALLQTQPKSWPNHPPEYQKLSLSLALSKEREEDTGYCRKGSD